MVNRLINDVPMMHYALSTPSAQTRCKTTDYTLTLISFPIPPDLHSIELGTYVILLEPPPGRMIIVALLIKEAMVG